MGKKDRTAEDAPSFRVLIGFNYQGGRKRHEPGELLGPGEYPKHGTGQCGDHCTMTGAHDWMIQPGANQVLAQDPPPAPPEPGALSVVEEAGAVALADDAGAVSPAEG